MAQPPSRSSTKAPPRPQRRVRPRPHKLTPLTTAAEARILLSPARFEIFEFLRAIAPCTVAELAESLDKPADGLYPHLRKLEKIGVIEVVDRVPEGKTTAAVYDLTGDDVRFKVSDQPDAGNDAVGYMADLTLRVARKAVRDAKEAGTLRLGGKETPLILRSDLSWLTEEDVAEIRRLTDQILAILERGRRAQDGKLYMHLQMLIPTIRTRSYEG